MELLDNNVSPEYAMQCIKWCAENEEIAALEAHLELHKNIIKDKLIRMIMDAISKRRTGVVMVLLSALDQELRTIYNKEEKSWLQKLFLSAIEFGDTTAVKELIEKGANVNGTCYGKPVLHLAACYGHLDIVTELVKAGGDISSLDSKGESIIHSVLTSQLVDKVEMVKRVIGLGADPLAKSSSGKLPIHVAAKNCPDVLVLFIKDGQDVNTRDEINRETPLHIACGAACRETILTLIQCGCHFNMENNQRQTPLAKLLRFTANDHDFHAKTRLAIAKSLIAIGFRMSRQSHNSCSRSKGRDKCRDRYTSLKMSLKTPPRLQNLSRMTVRESLISGVGLQKEIDKFEIPLNLKSYILFQELKI